MLLLAASAPACRGPGRDLVVIHTQNTKVTVPVEIADDPDEHRRGLMWRESLAPGHGMLFVFPDQSPRTFWMKNTALSLDIIFLDTAGKIVAIAEQTAPYSQRPISSRVPARYVLEVEAGFCRRHGLARGDKVHLPRSME
jgi:uncharacterized membrane protein (UPF0127 family)